jgi:hypothetical protein
MQVRGGAKQPFSYGLKTKVVLWLLIAISPVFTIVSHTRTLPPSLNATPWLGGVAFSALIVAMAAGTIYILKNRERAREDPIRPSEYMVVASCAACVFTLIGFEGWLLLTTTMIVS